MTKQRRLVYDVVHGSCEHLTAEQVYNLAKEQMPAIVMATVYNNLNALTETGLLRRVSIHGEPDRYDRPEIPHEHLKCDVCGAVHDLWINEMRDRLTDWSGISITDYELNLHYICDKCRSNNKTN